MFEKQHTLCWPIDSLSTVTARPVAMADYRKISEKDGSNRDLVALSTGLTDQQIKQLVAPDYTSIEGLVLEMQSPAAQLMDSFDPASPQLLVPITGDDGRDIKGYKLKPPTVATTDLMDQYEGDFERTQFLVTACTELSPAEQGRMSLPDWNQLQERLTDFLQKPAGFFRAKTVKS